jgi:hypothetical protein
MRRLHLHTFAQWACDRRWKTTTSRPGHGDVVRVRYLTCRRCGLKVKTAERLAVPWDAGELVAQVKALLPEGQAVALPDKGITELPLAPLNARLASFGYVIHASEGRDGTRLVACMDQDGRVTPHGCLSCGRWRWRRQDARTARGARGKIAPLLAIGTQSSRKKGTADETIVLTGDEPHE